MLDIEKALPLSNFDLGGAFFVYKNKVALDVCFIIITKRVYDQYKGLYHQCKAIIKSNCLKILFDSRFSNKYRCKLLLAIACH